MHMYMYTCTCTYSYISWYIVLVMFILKNTLSVILLLYNSLENNFELITSNSNILILKENILMIIVIAKGERERESINIKRNSLTYNNEVNSRCCGTLRTTCTRSHDKSIRSIIRSSC